MIVVCPGVNPFGQTHPFPAAPVSNPFLPAGQMYVAPPFGQQTNYTQSMQPVPGFNQFGGVVPASGSHFAPPTSGQFNVPNGGGVWANQPVIGQVPGQLNTWAQPAPTPASAAVNPFIVSLLTTSLQLLLDSNKLYWIWQPRRLDYNRHQNIHNKQ